MDSEIYSKLNTLYEAMETKKSPDTLNRFEFYWNDGFYKGKLFAMEFVVKSLLGIDGDELKSKNKNNL